MHSEAGDATLMRGTLGSFEGPQAEAGTTPPRRRLEAVAKGACSPASDRGRPSAHPLPIHANAVAALPPAATFRPGQFIYHVSLHQLTGLLTGAEIVDNFTISGNSLGDQEWSGYVPVTTIADNGSIVNTGEYGFNNGSW